MTAVLLGLAVAAAGLVYDPDANAADPKRAVGLALGIAALALVLGRGRTEARPRWSAAAACALGFVACSAISALWGIPAGLLDLGTWVAAVALAFAAASLGREGAVRAAQCASLALGAGMAILAIVSFVRGAHGIEIHGGQGNANWLGLTVAVCLPLSIDAATRPTHAARARIAYALVVALEVVALYLSHSRVAWLAGAVAVAVIAVRRPAVALAIGAAAAAALLATAMAAGSDEDVPAADALRGRAWIWRLSAAAGARALPFGGGLGSFGHRFLETQGDALAALPTREAARHFVNATTAHDDWLQVLVESGPLAAALLVLAFAFAIRAHLRSGWRAGAASLVAAAICATGDSPLRQPAIVFVLALTIAAIPPERTRARRSIGALARYGALAAAACLLFVSTRSWLGARLRTAAERGPLEARVATLARATRIDPASGESALSLGLARLERDDAAAAVADLERARALVANGGTDVALGNAHASLGHHADAETAYRRALALAPGSFRAHLNLAQTLTRRGQLDEALEHASAARLVLPGHPKLQGLFDAIAEARMDRD